MWGSVQDRVSDRWMGEKLNSWMGEGQGAVGLPFFVFTLLGGRQRVAEIFFHGRATSAHVSPS